MSRRNRILKMQVAGFDGPAYEVERLAGLPYTKISRIINGTARPSCKEKENLSRVLGKSVDDLFPAAEPVEAA